MYEYHVPINAELQQVVLLDNYSLCKAHYSVAKAGHMLGFGSENVISVETDEAGKMKPSSLEKAIVDCKNAVKMNMINLIIACCKTNH